ncbi:MAG TPA: HAD family hydrolase [Planctomycetota bacterium]|nr:HAD family hydrolase [Planctomycetota bacterium]
MSRSSLQAVIFDLDGTLTRPYLNFRAIQAAIGVAEPLLESMLALPPGPARDRAFGILEGFEAEAAEASELNVGARDVLAQLRERAIPTAVLTRNSRRSTERVLRKHGLQVEVCLTRDDAPAKPRPEPLWMICERFGVLPAQALMVGDFKFDILAGRNAGTRTALLTHGTSPAYLEEIRPDHLLERLEDLLALFPAD